jgi:hypothetical protein
MVVGFPKRGSIVETDRVRTASNIFGIYQVINIRPHLEPYPSNKHYDTVDIQLRDTHKAISSESEVVRFQKAYVLQRDIGNLSGYGWLPKIGDLVVVAFIGDKTPIILGQLYNDYQEPVVRVEGVDDEYNVSKIEKWTQFEMPQTKNANTEYLWVDHPQPKQTVSNNYPICHKIFSTNRDEMSIHECEYGVYGNDPYCENCKRMGYPQACTSIKTYSQESTNPDDSARDDGKGEKARRWVLHHHTGSDFWMDEDGTIFLQNAVSDADKGYIKFNEYGTIITKSSKITDTSTGAYTKVISDTDTGETNAVELKYIPTGTSVVITKAGKVVISCGTSTIDITQDGIISITSPTEVAVTAPTIALTGEVVVGG